MPGHDDGSEDDSNDQIIDTFHTTHDWEEHSSVSSTVIQAIGTVLGKPMMELEILYDTIDTTALDAIFQPISERRPRDEGAVSFSVEGVSVTVYASGEIVLRAPAACPWEHRDREPP